MADITGVLSSSRFRPTNIKVLSLLFTEYPFSLPWHAGHTFLIGFMFYQLLLRVVTHEKCDETRVLSFPFLARPSQGPATWLVTSAIVTMFTKPSALACTCWWSFRPLNNSQPEETDKMCRNINSQTGSLCTAAPYLKKTDKVRGGCTQATRQAPCKFLGFSCYRLQS